LHVNDKHISFVLLKETNKIQQTNDDPNPRLKPDINKVKQ